MVITVPAWTERRLEFQDPVYYFERVYNCGIVRRADAIAHQLQESGVDDFFGGKLVLRSGRPICEHQGSRIGVLVRAVITDICRVDADIMPSNALNQSSLCSNRPRFYVRF